MFLPSTALASAPSPITLFYKGTGSAHRTPSAWLDPTCSCLLLRASTHAANDVGASGKLRLQPGRWTHLAFTFRNLTEQVRAAADAPCASR